MNENVFYEQGLTSKEAQERRQNGLYNGAYQVRTKTVGQICYSNICTLFNMVNLTLGFLVFLVGSYRNMLFLGVVFWNIGVGIFQELHAKHIIDKLSIISQPRVNVFRDGKCTEISPDEICLDDVMFLASGKQICADAKILVGMLMVNENLITGESNPVEKHPGDTILSGSFVVTGKATARAIHVGAENYANTIIGQAKYIKKPNSEIMDSTKRIIKGVTFLLAPVAVTLFVKYLVLLKLPFRDTIISVVGAVVGMIPNGLMLLTTCVLATSVIRLAKHHTLVQELYCIETLARVDVVCLDKTGTITEGRMQLEEMLYLPSSLTEEEVRHCIAEFHQAMEDENDTIMAVREGVQGEAEWSCSERIPFQSANKWSLAHFKGHGSFVLGAPENVLKNRLQAYQETLEPYILQGNRVLVFAFSKEKPEGKNLPNELVPLAFLIINEKIRENAPKTLAYFKEQGVTLKVISGDHPKTVSTIAKRAGLESADKYLDATTISPDADYHKLAEAYTIFGRVTPDQKLKLIRALKENGHTTAMTGDGINDVLALKEADCSIAMQSGSDAARSASQLVLLDSDFASMPAIVAEGRRSINNLERSATLYLVKTIYASLLAVCFVFLSMPYPFEPVHLTMIGSLAIGIPSFVLAMEPNKERIRGHFLANVLKISIPGGLTVVANVLLTLFLIRFVIGENEQFHSTMATYSTFITSMIILYHVCKPFNRIKAILMGTMIGAFVIETVFLKHIFNLKILLVELNICLAVLGIVSFFVFKCLSILTKKMMRRFLL